MNRQQAREAARTALDALGTYQAVYEGARRVLDGMSPIATVLSKGSAYVDLTRGSNDEERHRLSVTLYVRCDEGSEDTAEDQLDGLVEAALTTLASAGFVVEESDSAPEGAPLRNIDGVFYRVERIPIVHREFI